LPGISLAALLPVLALGMGITATAYGAAEEQGSRQAQLPKGVIVMWSGNMDEIPEGWSLCDGTKGTPDLRDRFVVGAGSSAHVGVKGGSYSHGHKQDTHSHRVTMPRSRVNTLRIPYGSRDNYGSLSYKIQQQRHYADSRVANSSKLAPVIQTAQNLPPYVKMVFIMKN
jgi:microcystin-dependent protein